MKRTIMIILMFISMLGVASATFTGELQNYYQLDLNGTDSTGNSDATLNGGVTFIPGVINNASQTDGAASYIDTGITTFNNSMTLNFWLNTTETAERIHGVFDGGTSLFQMYVNQGGTDGKMQIFTRSSSGNDFVCHFTNSSINDGNFHMITFVFEQTTNTCAGYVDAISQSVNTAGSLGTPNLLSTSGSFYFGARNRFDITSVDQFLDADWDEWGLWTEQLSAANITTLYNNGAGFSYPFVVPPAEINIAEITLGGVTLVNGTAFNATPKDLYVNFTYALGNVSNLDATWKVYNSSTSPAAVALTPVDGIVNESVAVSEFGLDQAENLLTLFVFDITDTSVNRTFDYDVIFDTTPPIIANLTPNGAIIDNFSLDFASMFTVTDSLSGLASCKVNITELDNVTTGDNQFIDCTASQAFSSAGLHNAFVTATDNAGNVQTYTQNFTINPIIKVFFKFTNSTVIESYTATITHPDTRITTPTINVDGSINLSPVNNGSLDLGVHSILFEKVGIITQSVTINVTENFAASSVNFTMDDARIVLNIRDQATGAVISGTNFTVEFVATVGLSTSTTTGLVNVTNLLFLNEQYLVVISNADYQTETIIFNFNNQELIELDAYMIEANNTNLGVVFIKPVDRFSQPIPNVIVRALQWDSSSSSYVSVSQSISGSDGLASLNVILNDEIYIFTATLDGINANSTSEIIDTTENGKTVTIILAGVAQEFDYVLEDVITSATESFNNVTNISTVTLNWEDVNGISQTVCISSYRVISTSQSLLTRNCTSGSSGIYVLSFAINNSFQTDLVPEIQLGSNYIPIDRFVHLPADHPSDVFEDLGLTLFIVPFLVLVSIAIGMYVENVYIGTMAVLILGGLSLSLAPNVLTKGIVMFMFFVGWLTINYGVKQR